MLFNFLHHSLYQPKINLPIVSRHKSAYFMLAAKLCNKQSVHGFNCRLKMNVFRYIFPYLSVSVVHIVAILFVTQCSCL